MSLPEQIEETKVEEIQSSPVFINFLRKNGHHSGLLISDIVGWYHEKDKYDIKVKVFTIVCNNARSLSFDDTDGSVCKRFLDIFKMCRPVVNVDLR